MLIIHLTFALTLSEFNKGKKVVLGIIATILATGITSIPLVFGLELHLDMYGYWDLIIFYAIGTIGAWELLHQITRRIKGDNSARERE